MKRGRLASRGCGRKRVRRNTVSASVSPLLKLWTTPASTEPSPRVEPKHPTRGEGSTISLRSRCVQNATKSAYGNGNEVTEDQGNCVVSSPCSRAASASPSPNRPKKHSRHPRKLGALPVPHRRLPRAQLRGDVDHHHRRSAVVDAVVCHRAGDQLPQRSFAVAGHRDARGVRRGGHLAHELANLGACGVVRGDCDDWGGCIRVLGLTLKKK